MRSIVPNESWECWNHLTIFEGTIFSNSINEVADGFALCRSVQIKRVLGIWMHLDKFNAMGVDDVTAPPDSIMAETEIKGFPP